MKKIIAKSGQNTFVVELTDDARFVRYKGGSHKLDFHRVSKDLYSLLLDSKSYEIYLHPQHDITQVIIDGIQYEVRLEDERSRLIQRLHQERPSEKSVIEIRAPMPGLVTSVIVSPGMEVDGGQGLLILEAMKMENEIRAPSKGRVKEIPVKEGVPVEKGDLLARISA